MKIYKWLISGCKFVIMRTLHNDYTFDYNDTTDTYHKIYILKKFIPYTSIFPFPDVFYHDPCHYKEKRKLGIVGVRWLLTTLSHSLYIVLVFDWNDDMSKMFYYVHMLYRYIRYREAFLAGHTSELLCIFKFAIRKTVRCCFIYYLCYS